MMVNGALYDLMRAAPRARACRRGGGGAAGGGAHLRRRAHAPNRRNRRARAALKIGLVQPNFAYTVDGEFSRDEALRQLTALQEQSRRLQRAGAQLLVWSEGSYPVAVPRDFSADFRADSLAMIRRGFSVPVLIGADMYDAVHDDAFNSAILLDGNGKGGGPLRQGAAAGFRRIHPRHRDLSVAAKISAGGAGRFTAGVGPGVISLQGPRANLAAGPVICYEDILPGYLRGSASCIPTLLVNLDQRFMVRRGHRAVGTSGTVGVCQCRAAREHGARGQFRRVGADRSERPSDCRKPTPTILTAIRAAPMASWSPNA
jgi:apolipoprotein N-acyltransferase